MVFGIDYGTWVDIFGAIALAAFPASAGYIAVLKKGSSQLLTLLDDAPVQNSKFRDKAADKGLKIAKKLIIKRLLK